MTDSSLDAHRSVQATVIPSLEAFQRVSERVTETNEIERKWVRVQAAIDELGDTLSIRLRTILGKLKEGEVQDATELLEEMIESVEVFSGPTEANEENE